MLEIRITPEAGGACVSTSLNGGNRWGVGIVFPTPGSARRVAAAIAAESGKNPVTIIEER